MYNVPGLLQLRLKSPFLGGEKADPKGDPSGRCCGVAPEFCFFWGEKNPEPQMNFSHESKFSTFGSYIPPRICCDLLIYQAQGEKTGWSKMNISLVNGVKSIEKKHDGKKKNS